MLLFADGEVSAFYRSKIFLGHIPCICLNGSRRWTILLRSSNITHSQDSSIERTPTALSENWFHFIILRHHRIQDRARKYLILEARLFSVLFLFEKATHQAICFSSTSLQIQIGIFPKILQAVTLSDGHKTAEQMQKIHSYASFSSRWRK